MCSECRLVNVVRVHVHLMIAVAEVKLGENPRATELVQQFIDHQDWELVFHRIVVQLAVVDAETPCAIMFLDQQDWG
jgi:hypothetical protein